MPGTERGYGTFPACKPEDSNSRWQTNVKASSPPSCHGCAPAKRRRTRRIIDSHFVIFALRNLCDKSGEETVNGGIKACVS